MILLSLTKTSFFKHIGTVIYLSSHINKTYGSISKPTNRFGQKSKYPDSKQPTSEQKPQAILQGNESKPSQQTNEKEAKRPHNVSPVLPIKKNPELAFFFRLEEQEQLDTIEEYRQKELIKQLSKICKQMNLYKVKSDAVWTSMQNAFVYFLRPPYDQDKIRSLSSFINGLSKANRCSRDYQDQMINLLPLASVQSFTQIVVMISRLGPMNEKFTEIVQEVYARKRQEMGNLEINLVNYALAKNGRQIDTAIFEKVDTFNLRGITLMLKAFDRSGNITPELLKKCAQCILQRKSQTMFFQLKSLMAIYFKYQYFENFHLLHYFDEQLRFLASSYGLVNLEFIEYIWQYFPEAVNKNKLPPNLIDEFIKALTRQKQRNKISENKWKYFELSFNKIENKQVREKFKKISGK